MDKDLKFDRGKSRIDLIDPGFIKEIGDVMELGARKYTEESWKTIKDGKKRHTAALLRHLYAYLDGEEFDEETEASHLINVAFNVMCIRWADRCFVKTMATKCADQKRIHKELIKGGIGDKELAENIKTDTCIPSRFPDSPTYSQCC